MVRGRGGRSSNGNGGRNRATPYEGAREGRSRRRGGGGGGESKGRAKGGRHSRRGGDKPKSKTAEELDAEMDSYWGKSEGHAAKKLDSDMDNYWKNKDEKSKTDEDKKEDTVDGDKNVNKVVNKEMEDKKQEELVAQEIAPVTEKPVKE
ncbi:unnamed protein product [Peronospora effusa]|nr:unnamed protein product [Peronospora effusa]